MPTYVYRCERCGAEHEEQRAIADRRVAGICWEGGACRGIARLVPSATAGSFPGADFWRTRMKSRGTT